MDVVLLTAIAALLVVLIVGIAWFSRRGSKKTNRDGPGAGAAVPVRRAAGVRGVRQRRAPARAADEPQQQREDEGNEEVDETAAGESAELSKLGAKKRAKLEAKAERKAQREIEERDREERKRREQQQQEERDRQSLREREEEHQREAAEKAALEERERREHEEYVKLREAFSVEEEGYAEAEESAQQNLLLELVEHVRQSKVVLLEDLGQRFGIKTQAAIERIRQLLDEGTLSGVIDDRGKFIYIPEEELRAVAKFVSQRGRVSIAELVEHSNTLINLNPGSCVPLEA